MSAPTVRPAFLTLAIAFLPACGSTTAPGSGVTILVTNETCIAGPCPPLEIHGFVPKFSVPGQPPWGFLDIGTVTAASTCLRLPASHTLTVTGPNGAADLTWTVADPIILTAIDRERALQGTTDEFVPADAPGWTIGFGGSSQGTPTASSACNP